MAHPPDHHNSGKTNMTGNPCTSKGRRNCQRGNLHSFRRPQVNEAEAGTSVQGCTSTILLQLSFNCPATTRMKLSFMLFTLGLLLTTTTDYAAGNIAANAECKQFVARNLFMDDCAVCVRKIKGKTTSAKTMLIHVEILEWTAVASTIMGRKNLGANSTNGVARA
ncbi:uncharacterized protein LOC135401523 [Ornithodoros turicata]|uniref:uncharacterized protein LOC135401523 n=1 Tax=Ornithodoros turicata TaxID=34597 RepID=UPI003138D4C8